MSYCRMSDDSDVYMFESITKVVECCYCLLEPDNTKAIVRFEKRSDAIAHLQKHLDNGHKVPQSAFDKLRLDIVQEGDMVL